jgi:hypothetical protein
MNALAPRLSMADKPSKYAAELARMNQPEATHPTVFFRRPRSRALPSGLTLLKPRRAVKPPLRSQHIDHKSALFLSSLQRLREAGRTTAHATFAG